MLSDEKSSNRGAECKDKSNRSRYSPTSKVTCNHSHGEFHHYLLREG
jgi:hypothetical protein